MSGPERTVLFVYNTGTVARLVGKGSLKGKNWTLGAGTFTIGREPTNNLVLDNEPGVSKVHCKVTLEDGAYVVLDAESRNGTLVNGTPVKKSVLKNGDEIRICNVVLGFESRSLGGDDATPAAAETTERLTSATRRAAQEAARGEPGGSVWPWMAFGMLLFFGAAGGAAWYLGFLDGLLGTQESAPAGDTPPPTDLPKDVPPPTPPAVKGRAASADAPLVTPPPREKDPAPAPAAAAEIMGTLLLVQPGGADASGRLEVKHTLTARVRDIPAKQGAVVKKGQVLFTYDDAEAMRRLSTAREVYNQLKEVVAAQDTDRARKALAEAKADLDRAQSGASSLRVTAPADGTLAELTAEEGKRASKGTVALVLTTGGGTPAWTVAFKVPEGQKLAAGAAVLVVLGGKSLPATVSKVTDGEATATLDREPPGARDGLQVTIKLP